MRKGLLGLLLLSGGVAFGATHVLVRATGGRAAAARAAPVVDPTSLSEMEIAAALAPEKRIFQALGQANARASRAAADARTACAGDGRYDGAQLRIDLGVRWQDGQLTLTSPELRQLDGSPLPPPLLACLRGFLASHVNDSASVGPPPAGPPDAPSFSGAHHVAFRLAPASCK